MGLMIDSDVDNRGYYVRDPRRSGPRMLGMDYEYHLNNISVSLRRIADSLESGAEIKVSGLAELASMIGSLVSRKSDGDPGERKGCCDVDVDSDK